MAAVGRFRQRVSGELPRLTFALHRMPGIYLTPSTESRYVMRFHAVCVRSHTFVDQQVADRRPTPTANRHGHKRVISTAVAHHRAPTLSAQRRCNEHCSRFTDYNTARRFTDYHCSRAWARVNRSEQNVSEHYSVQCHAAGDRPVIPCLYSRSRRVNSRAGDSQHSRD